MNKKIYILILAVLVVFVGSFFHVSSYSNKFVGKIYFCKMYEKTDDEFLSTSMYGDVILFEKEKIIVFSVVDLDKVRESLSKEQLSTFNYQKGKYIAFAYEYDGINYSYFDKKISANDMDEIKVLNSNKIEYHGKEFILENDLNNVFYNGQIPGVTIIKPL